MRRFLVVAFLIIIILFVVITVFGGPREAAPALPQDAELPTITPTLTMEPLPTAVPTEAPIEMPLMLFWETPEQVDVGFPQEFPLILVGDGNIADIGLTAQFPILYLDVIEIVLGLPDEEVIISEISPEGLLTFEANLLTPAAGISRTLLTAYVIPTTPSEGIVSIDFLDSFAFSFEGMELSLNPQPALFEVVGEAPTPEPTPIPTPVPTMPPAGTLCPPTTGPADVAPGAYYRIQPGQTLFTLAEAFGTTAEAIAQANNIADVTQVPAGTLLHIPVAAPVGQAAYFVAPGETLYSIAKTFNVQVEILAEMNALAPPYHIEAGRWLVLLP